MRPEESTSPEEKLLKLIRGDRKPKDKASAEKAVPTKPSVIVRPRYRITPVNTALITVLVIIACVLLFDVINFNLKRPVYVSEISPNTGGDTQPKPEFQPSPQSQDSSETSGNFATLASRDLFKAPAAVSKESVSQVSSDKSRDLSLKGIIAGDRPQAIIEDEKNKKTYFLFKGESVSDIKVEDIQSDRVILKVSGEVLELTL